MRRCKACHTPLPLDLPSFHTMCRSCFALAKKVEGEEIKAELAAARRRAEAAELELLMLRQAAGRTAGKGDAGKILQSLGFNRQAVMKLIQLCHPDRHDNSPTANEMTRLLLDVRKRIE
jgi:hypothetical protein